MNKLLYFQKKLNNKFPNENLTALSYNGCKNNTSIKCNTCGRVYSFEHAENAYSKRKKFICGHCVNANKRFKRFYDRLVSIYPHDALNVINFTSLKDKCDIQCKNCFR